VCNLRTLTQGTVCSNGSHHTSLRVSSQISSWKTLCGRMPQGSRLSPLSFIVMIDDLRANCEIHKFIDDTTFSELLTPSYSPSNMTNYLSSLLIWTGDDDMQLNTFKTKEMVLGRTDSTSVPSVSTQLAQSNVSLPSSYLVVMWTLVYPGRPTLISLYPKQANNCTS